MMDETHDIIFYYYACSYPLASGSIINPGNWGRIIQKYNISSFGNPWILFREEVFEKVRQSEFPTKPSRYKSIFLCETKDMLAQFLQLANRSLDLIYEVELLDATAPIHRGCLLNLDFAPQENMQSFTLKARAYWNGANVQRPEIASTSSIKIISQLS